MTSLTRGLGRLAVLAVAFSALAGSWGAPAASATTGSVLADLTPTGGLGGVSVAFDGQYVYTTDRDGIVLRRTAPNGAAAGDIPILGSVPINAIAYDATRDVFWGVDATGTNVYRIEKDGWAGLQFTILPLFDLPGSCNVLGGCSPVVSGFAFDATDDSIWYLPQGSQRVYHLTTAGQYLGYFDTSLGPDCLSNAATGIAAGKGVLYLTAAGCAKGFQYSKSDTGVATKLSSFSVTAAQSAGAACDNVSFPSKTVMWVRDSATNHLRAIEIPAGSCVFGGGVANPTGVRWMSGAGQAIGTEIILNGAYVETGVAVQHAFHLLCDQAGADQPNNMVINWKDMNGNHFSFKLDVVTTMFCLDDGTDASPPPCDPTTNPRCFNKIVGEGWGKLIGRTKGGTLIAGGTACPNSPNPPDCGFVNFTFTDRGEPNLGIARPQTMPPTFDDGEFQVTDFSVREGNPTGILDACGCFRANYQAHQHA